MRRRQPRVTDRGVLDSMLGAYKPVLPFRPLGVRAPKRRHSPRSRFDARSARA
jgi:hypothetical protein